MQNRRFIRFIAPFHCFGEVAVEENPHVYPGLLCSCRARASFPLTDTPMERRELKGGGYRRGDHVEMETDTGKKIPFVVVDNIVHLDTWRQEIVLEANDAPAEDAKFGISPLLPALRELAHIHAVHEAMGIPTPIIVEEDCVSLGPVSGRSQAR